MRPRTRAALPSLGAAAGPPLVLLVAVLVVWQGYVVVTDVPSVVLPSPVGIASAALDAWATLLRAAAVTALTAGIGLAGGIALGAALAFGMSVSRTTSAVVHPYLIVLRIAPTIAIAPLVLFWLGDGLLARALLVTSLTVFPVTVASLDGLRSTPAVYLDLMRSVEAPRWAVFLRVRVPAAAPSVFAGLKLGAALSIVGAVVAEFLTLRSGIGYRVFEASMALDTTRMFAALFVLAGLGLAFYAVPTAVETRFLWTEDR